MAENTEHVINTRQPSRKYLYQFYRLSKVTLDGYKSRKQTGLCRLIIAFRRARCVKTWPRSHNVNAIHQSVGYNSNIFVSGSRKSGSKPYDYEFQQSVNNKIQVMVKHSDWHTVMLVCTNFLLGLIKTEIHDIQIFNVLYFANEQCILL